jgi:glycosyltransferase involved in cell wall biosynthesis
MWVSVVVPTYQRPELLARCLAALLRQTFDPRSFEIIVADDAASPDTRRQVLALASTAPVEILYVPVTEKHGPAAARNVGWRRAGGAIVAFTDDDCLAEKDWLTAGVARFKDDRVLAVSGKVRVPLPPFPTDYDQDAAGLEHAEFVTANCFCRRSALEQVGGFDERFEAAWREDSDLHFALLRLSLSTAVGERGWGEGVQRAEDAAVVHPVRPAPWGVSLRQQRKSLFDALLFKKHRALYRERIRPGTPWLYYVAVGSLAASAAAAAAGLPLVALAGLGAWAFGTARFCARRLRRTSRAPRHVAEMLVTSMLIPPLSVFWRLYGAVKFRVLFW